MQARQAVSCHERRHESPIMEVIVYQYDILLLEQATSCKAHQELHGVCAQDSRCPGLDLLVCLWPFPRWFYHTLHVRSYCPCLPCSCSSFPLFPPSLLSPFF